MKSSCPTWGPFHEESGRILLERSLNGSRLRTSPRLAARRVWHLRSLTHCWSPVGRVSSIIYAAERRSIDKIGRTRHVSFVTAPFPWALPRGLCGLLGFTEFFFLRSPLVSFSANIRRSSVQKWVERPLQRFGVFAFFSRKIAHRKWSSQPKDIEKWRLKYGNIETDKTGQALNYKT